MTHVGHDAAPRPAPAAPRRCCPTSPTDSGSLRRSRASSTSAKRRRRGRARAGRSSRSPPGARMRASIDVDAEEGGAVHRRGERLGAAHAAEPAGHDQPARERAAEVLAGALGEGLVGALEDALRADVDPRAGRHLAVHREPERLEPAELVPGGPARHQVRVGDQHPRRLVVGAEHADRLAALHQQRLVVLQPPERGDDRARSSPSCARPCPPPP